MYGVTQKSYRGSSRKGEKNLLSCLHTVLRFGNIIILASTVYHKLLLISPGHIHLRKGF